MMAGHTLKDESEQGALRTGHLLTNFRNRAITSGLLTVCSQGAVSMIALASVVVLARILSPVDYGLVTMVLTVTGAVRIFSDSGLSTATVQGDGVTHTHRSRTSSGPTQPSALALVWRSRSLRPPSPRFMGSHGWRPLLWLYRERFLRLASPFSILPS